MITHIPAEIFLNTHALGHLAALFIMCFSLIVIILYLLLVENMPLLRYVLLSECALFLSVLSSVVVMNAYRTPLVILANRMMQISFVLFAISCIFLFARFSGIPKSRMIQWVHFSCGVLLIVLIGFTDDVVSNEAMRGENNRVTQSGILFPAYLSFHLITDLTLWWMARWQKKNHPAAFRRNQFIYISFGLFILLGMVAGIGLMYFSVLRLLFCANYILFVFISIGFFFRLLHQGMVDKEKLNKAFIYDAQTKVFSRNYLLGLLSHKAAVRLFTRRWFCMIDLNRFKCINDHYGHLAGDRVLSAFGEILQRQSNDNLAFGRLGGDEFAVLYTGQFHQELVGILRSIVSGYRELLLNEQMDPDGLRLGLSIGMVEIDTDKALETVLATADDLMYLAKAKGNNLMKYGHSWIDLNTPHAVVE